MAILSRYPEILEICLESDEKYVGKFLAASLYLFDILDAGILIFISGLLLLLQ